MSIEPPVIYERPSSHRWDAQLDRGFNPRAATQAAWLEAQREKEERMRPKSEGPLIDSHEINRHPDSYFIIPYGNLNFQPLSKYAKAKIVWTRRLQLLLRILGLFAAGGILAATILTIPAGDGSDWIIRVPPGIAILHCLYAIWHLSRGPGGRAPASTASYFIFGAIIDAALVPFMFFSAWVSRQEWVLAQGSGADSAWKTLVDPSGPQARITIFFVTWVVSVALGGISVVAFLMCVYLAVQFRKISALPPDMNPFETNLTSRTSKRRHNKSKSSTSQLPTAAAQSARESKISLMTEKESVVPWLHTRGGSKADIHAGSAPSSPSKSRPDSGISFSTPQMNRFSQYSVINGSSATLSNPKKRQGHVRTDSAGAVLQSKSPPESLQRQTAIPQVAQSTVTAPPAGYTDDTRSRAPLREANASPGAASSIYSDAPSWYTDAAAEIKSLHSDASAAMVQRPHGSPSLSNWPLSHVKFGKAEENWFAIGELSDDEEDENRLRGDIPELTYLRSSPRQTPQVTISKGKHDFSNRSPRPLEMHPPTPPTTLGQQSQQNQPLVNRISYPQQSPSPQSQRISYPQQSARHAGSPYANREARRNRPALQPASTGASNRRSVGLGDVEEAAVGGGQQQSLSTERRNERVISSGYEDERKTLGAINGNVKSRGVSGKAAEEGRAGAGWEAGSSMTTLRSQMGW